jgi:hypothetical protein
MSTVTMMAITSRLQPRQRQCRCQLRPLGQLTDIQEVASSARLPLPVLAIQCGRRSLSLDLDQVIQQLQSSIHLSIPLHVASKVLDTR